MTLYTNLYIKSLPAWGAWIEMVYLIMQLIIVESLPAWGAWIEIVGSLVYYSDTTVAPRVGSVD